MQRAAELSPRDSVRERMRIKSTDDRERLWDDLREATGEGHTSQALDAAARHYVRCRGGTAAVPTGTYAELLVAARDADGGLADGDRNLRRERLKDGDDCAAALVEDVHRRQHERDRNKRGERRRAAGGDPGGGATLGGDAPNWQQDVRQRHRDAGLATR